MEEDDDDEEEDEEEDEDEILEEEEGEFNDIIDERGIMVGEDWLVSEFIIDGQEAQLQERKIIALVEKDRQRRQQNLQNQSINQSQSPYNSQWDGRPIMRPITPIKSQQTNRITH